MWLLLLTSLILSLKKKKKKRKQLLEYFTRVREGLNDQGAFFIDLFGGTGSQK